MPAFLWALPAIRWIKSNPLQALQALAVASLIAAAVFFYLDYQDAKSDRASLREDLKIEQALTRAQSERINEFALSQEQQLQRLQRVEQFNAETRAQVRAALKGLSASEVKQVIQESPDEAAAILSSRFNALLGLFEYPEADSGKPSRR